MKKLSIAAASALAIGLAISSLPAQAQKTVSSVSTPGGGGGLNAANNAVSVTTQTIQLIEEIQSASKGSTTASKSNTYRIEPAGVTFSGPVRLCLKYNSATTRASQTGSALLSALTTVLSQIKDKSGKATYKQVPGDPEDDKINSQICVRLTSSY